jgi:hypothetical protein
VRRQRKETAISVQGRQPAENPNKICLFGQAPGERSVKDVVVRCIHKG